MKKPGFPAVLLLLSVVLLPCYLGSCKTDNPVGTGGGSSLIIHPDSLLLGVMAIASCEVSGGKEPYSISSISDTSVVAAAIVDSTLYVGGKAPGYATVVVRDSPGTSKGTLYVKVDTGATPPVSGQIGFYPSTLELQVGGEASAYAYGGILPYSIVGAPSSGIATASISGATITVHAVGAGSTSLLLSDASNPVRTGILPITVTGGGAGLDVSGTWTGTYTFTTGSLSGQTFDAEATFTGRGGGTEGTFRDISHNITWTLNQFSYSGTTIDASFTNPTLGALTVHGTLAGSTISGTFTDVYGSGTFSLTLSGGTISFSSTKGNFSATGNFDSTHFVTNVGGFSYFDSEYGFYYFVVLGIEVKSLTTYQSTALMFSSTSPITTGSYTGYPKFSTLSYLPERSIDDTSLIIYHVMNLAGSLSTFSTTSAQGTFSGKGANVDDPSDSITVSSGTFNVTYVNWAPWTVAPAGPLREAMKRTFDVLMRGRKR